MSIISAIQDRIIQSEPGTIFMTQDFADIALITTIRKCLGRLTESGSIRRIMEGMYEKPRYSTLLKEFLPADPEKAAYAIARNYQWNIAPCGDIALNKLGLSTQVPAVWSYVSDGPYREYQIGNTQLIFKHRTNKTVSMMSEMSIMVIEALKALGKNRVDDAVIEALKSRLPEDEKRRLLTEGARSAEWINRCIRKVCEPV